MIARLTWFALLAMLAVVATIAQVDRRARYEGGLAALVPSAYVGFATEQRTRQALAQGEGEREFHLGEWFRQDPLHGLVVDRDQFLLDGLDHLAHRIGNPRAVNLVVLGGALAGGASQPLFCTAEDIRAVLAGQLAAKPALLEKSYKALDAGLQAVAS